MTGRFFVACSLKRFLFLYTNIYVDDIWLSNLFGKICELCKVFDALHSFREKKFCLSRYKYNRRSRLLSNFNQNAVLVHQPVARQAFFPHSFILFTRMNLLFELVFYLPNILRIISCGVTEMKAQYPSGIQLYQKDSLKLRLTVSYKHWE